MELALALAALGGIVLFAAVRARRGGPASDRGDAGTREAAGAAPLPPIEPPPDPQLDEFLSRHIRNRRYVFRATLPSGEQIGVGHSPGDDWVDVAARRWASGKKGILYPGPYEAFGYNVRQGRWSFGADPPHAEEISRILTSYIGRRRRVPID